MDASSGLAVDVISIAAVLALLGVVGLAVWGGVGLWGLWRSFSSQSRAAPKQKTLPDGRTVYCLNDHETDFLFREIFVDQVYGNRA
jgi:hypothetical protein